MANFCGKCGSHIGVDGLCPNCDKSVASASEPTPIKSPAPSAKKKGKAGIIALVILLVTALCCGSVFTLIHFGILSFGPEKKDDKDQVKDPYEKIVQSIVSSYPWDNGGEPVPDIKGMSPLLVQCQKLEDLSYTLKDLDNNSTEELILAIKEENGFRIINIITSLKNEAIVVAGADEKTELWLSENDNIVNHSTDGDTEIYDSFKINEDGNGVEFENRVIYDEALAESLDYTDGGEGEYFENSWFYTEDPDDKESYEHISEDKAKDIILDCGIINFKPITEYENKADSPANEDENADPDGKDPANEDEEKAYAVKYEMDEADKDIDIEYIQYYLGVSFLCDGTDKWLIDYEGNVSVKCTNIERKDANGNVVIGYDGKPIIDNLGYYRETFKSGEYATYYHIDPVTLDLYIMETSMGGSGSFINYHYDDVTEKIYTGFYSEFSLYEKNVDFAPVMLIHQRPSTEDEKDRYGEYYYDMQYKYGIVVDNKLVVPCEYDDYMEFDYGICALEKDGKWTFFKSNGEKLLPYEYDEFKTVSNKLALTAFSENGTWGLVNEKGEKILAFEYDEISEASYGYIPVCKNGKWGYCDTDGNMVTGFEFEKALPLHKKLAWVKQDGKWLVIEFREYEEELTESEATKIIQDRYRNDENISTFTITLLSEKDSIPHYLGQCFCFKIEVEAKNGNSSTDYFKVLDNGIIVSYKP
ncbi:MAG: WG repeat-containing protein [Ruminococcaceae bacterium]|nr:WG repeat-containing protein [Oscillospiraceae bacterium]